MKQEEPEVSEELQELTGLVAEFETHKKRIVSLHNKGALKEVLSEELASTIMPLLADFVIAQVKHASLIEEMLMDLDEEISSEGKSEPDLTDEEVELFVFLLARFKEMVMGSQQVPNLPADTSTALLELESKIGLAQKVLERLTDVEEEETDEEEEADDSADAPD